MKQRDPEMLLFKKNDPKKFIDRKEIIDIIYNECNKMLCNSSDFFKVIDIYGIGGIGKSRLLSEIKPEIIQHLSGTKFEMIYVSFEIEKQQVLNNLIKIRKSYKHSCIVFDYALISYWDKSGYIEKIDDEFMYEIKSNLFYSLTDTIADVGVNLFPEFPGIPSISDIFECVGILIQKAQRLSIRNWLKSISQMSPYELLNRMPLFLGFDIERALRKASKTLIFLCDSYQQSIPYNESKEWLMDFISEIHYGLFVITGREKLNWNDPQRDILPYHLKGFPEDIARSHLKYYLSGVSEELIKEIILTTKCIPLFLDIAIDVYLQERNTNKPIDIVYFKNRDQLMKRFIYHLPEKWQGMLLALSVVRIFNRDIFMYLSKELGYACPLEDYEEITSTSLANYIERANRLIKLHDVFCSQAIKVLQLIYIKDVWHYYLKFIALRFINELSNDSQDSLLTLFLNLIHLCTELKLDITVQETEWLLDIFYQIMDSRTFFDPPNPNKEFNEKFNDLFHLFNAMVYEKVNTYNTFEHLTKIKNAANFGKHQKSYLVQLLYIKGILGQYGEFYSGLENLEEQLKDSDKIYWYYPRIKIYIVDYFIMIGKFRNALNQLIELKNIDVSTDVLFQIERSIGHLYRFNMELDLAEHSYKINHVKLQTSVNSRVYLQTNLCETYCYFMSEKFDEIYEKTLSDAISLGNLKNIGKLYYSKAIMLIRCKQFDKAYSMIQRSMGVNRRDGYQSGELFAYMARSYCDYAKYGEIKSNTYMNIEKLIQRNNVYQFFRLPLAIMKDDDESIEAFRDSFDWLDFDHTVNQYKLFFKSIRFNDGTE